MSTSFSPICFQNSLTEDRTESCLHHSLSCTIKLICFPCRPCCGALNLWLLVFHLAVADVWSQVFSGLGRVIVRCIRTRIWALFIVLGIVYSPTWQCKKWPYVRLQFIWWNILIYFDVCTVHLIQPHRLQGVLHFYFANVTNIFLTLAK